MKTSLGQQSNRMRPSISLKRITVQNDILCGVIVRPRQLHMTHSVRRINLLVQNFFIELHTFCLIFVLNLRDIDVLFALAFAHRKSRLRF